MFLSVGVVSVDGLWINGWMVGLGWFPAILHPFSSPLRPPTIHKHKHTMFLLSLILLPDVGREGDHAQLAERVA